MTYLEAGVIAFCIEIEIKWLREYRGISGVGVSQIRKCGGFQSGEEREKCLFRSVVGPLSKQKQKKNPGVLAHLIRSVGSAVRAFDVGAKKRL